MAPHHHTTYLLLSIFLAANAHSRAGAGLSSSKPCQVFSVVDVVEKSIGEKEVRCLSEVVLGASEVEKEVNYRFLVGFLTTFVGDLPRQGETQVGLRS